MMEFLLYWSGRNRGSFLLELIIVLAITAMLLPIFGIVIRDGMGRLMVYSDRMNRDLEWGYIETFIRNDFANLAQIDSLNDTRIEFVTINGDVISYELKNAKIRRQKGGGIRYISHEWDIDHLGFRLINDQLIEIKIGLEETALQYLFPLLNRDLSNE